MSRLISLLVVAMLTAASPVWAQRSAGGPAETSDSAESMPISVERVRRELARPESSRETALRLDYYVEVYGKMAALPAYFKDSDFTGPAPYGGPTHRDILNMITPQEFRAPAADIGALVTWINQKLKERQERKDREARERQAR